MKKRKLKIRKRNSNIKKKLKNLTISKLIILILNDYFRGIL